MKQEFKTFFLVFAALALLIGALTFGITRSNNFPVKKFAAVEQTVGPDGRYVAGSPEVYQIGTSPAYAWKSADGTVKLFRIIGLIFFACAGIYMALSHLDYIRGKLIYAYIALVFGFGCYIGAYSSAFVSNFIEVDRDTYELVKDNPKEIEILFNAKPWIK